MRLTELFVMCATLSESVVSCICIVVGTCNDHQSYSVIQVDVTSEDGKVLIYCQIGREVA